MGRKRGGQSDGRQVRTTVSWEIEPESVVCPRYPAARAVCVAAPVMQSHLPSRGCAAAGAVVVAELVQNWRLSDVRDQRRATLRVRARARRIAA